MNITPVQNPGHPAASINMKIKTTGTELRRNAVLPATGGAARVELSDCDSPPPQPELRPTERR
jgi:hypothetical protein